MTSIPNQDEQQDPHQGNGQPIQAEQPNLPDLPMKPKAEPLKLVIVTGLAGAGRTAALRCLEDQGYEAIDNLPLTLLPSLLAESDSPRPLAIGLDARSRAFSSAAVQQLLHVLRDRAAARLLFLEASEAVLMRRFKESRRPHPLASFVAASSVPNPDQHSLTLIEAMTAERQLLAPIRDEADLVIDTTEMKTDGLKRLLQSRLPAPYATSINLTLMSFAYKRGLPPEADWVFDMRFLRNPYYEPAMRLIDGRQDTVAAYIDADPAFTSFMDQVLSLLQTTIPLYERDNRSYLTIAFGCTGGFHRSVRTVSRLHDLLQAAGIRASLVHRDISHGP
ncbi:MAG: RNase adapter RapZ [Alphaproteobacteria bacterium]|nr:RNase adapter RapZ [Alphaproteobacteria bacterium]